MTGSVVHPWLAHFHLAYSLVDATTTYLLFAAQPSCPEGFAALMGEVPTGEGGAL